MRKTVEQEQVTDPRRSIRSFKIRDYIEKYNLAQYDEFESDQIASEGWLWIVQAGAYKSLNNAKKLQRRLEKMGVIAVIKKYCEVNVHI